MRLWLGAAFAGVSLITAAAVYLFVDDSSGRTLQSESADLAVGKTSPLADRLAKLDKQQVAAELAATNTETLEAWGLNRHGNPLAGGQNLDTLAALPPNSYAGPAPGSRALGLQSPMQRGLDVRLLQLALSQFGADVRADGVFGRASSRSVAEHQSQIGLPVSGVADRSLVLSLATSLGL